MPVTQQLVVSAANRPGALARVCEVLAAGKVNITGLDASGRSGQIRLLVNSPAKAARLLKKAKLRSRLEDVVTVSLADRPGALARLARKLAAGKVNINYAYGSVARGGRRAAIVLGVGKPGRAARRAR